LKVFTLLLCAALLVGCGPSEQDIVGHWDADGDDGFGYAKHSCYFGIDGEFQITTWKWSGKAASEKGGADSVVIRKGTWRLDGSEIVIDDWLVTSTGLAFPFGADTNRYLVEQVDDNRLFIRQIVPEDRAVYPVEFAFRRAVRY
jgi:hypothetical protein